MTLKRTLSRQPKFSEASFRSHFQKCADVVLQKYSIGNQEFAEPLLLMYADGLVESRQIGEFILPNLERLILDGLPLDEGVMVQLTEVTHDTGMAELSTLIFNGQLLLYFEERESMYMVNISQPPDRSVEESTTESSIKGPRDGFTENLSTNVALIRKRLRTSSLRYEQFSIGRRSKTKVALLYVQDIANPEIIDEARNRINKLDVDALIGITQLDHAISNNSFALLPLTDYIGRPDYAAQSLVSGRFIVLMEGSPLAVIAPITLMNLLQSPEDAHIPYHVVAMQKLLRLAGLIISLLLPAFYVAITSYNTEQIPFPLLTTIVNARIGLPLSSPVEAFIMLCLFELFREAGVRLPKAVGQTVTVVGGLIIGDAAIRAGFTAPTLVVVVAVTVIATFTLVNQSLSGAVTFLRFYILLMSSFLGMFGFFIGFFTLILYMATLESYGVPYLQPFSPPVFQDMLDAYLKKPPKFDRKRPAVLNTIDSTKQGKDSQ